MKSSEVPIIEYRGAARSCDSIIDDESADAREIFGWLFVSLVCVPLFFGLVLAIGSVLR